MAEVIKNFVAPIATLPGQSVLAGEIVQLQRSLARTRRADKRKELEAAIDMRQRRIDEIRGRKA
jgi:hypothetical protein